VRDHPIYPVFVLTARANMEKFFKDFNVDGFMSKPFEISELMHEISFIINKNSPKAKAPAGDNKKIFLVEGNEEMSRKIGEALLNKGFKLNIAKSGVEAIERISKDVPGIVCVNMNLSDIAGEMVIQKLKHMAKTSRIKSILYVFALGENPEITDKIQSKEGIDKLVQLSSEKSLLDAIDDLLMSENLNNGN
jgi:DNA-binding response OmpR family regulator